MAIPKFPRDTIVQFQYAKPKEAIITVARCQGALKYKEHKIIALLDLSPEILTKRKTMKPVTNQLKNKNVKFRWSVMSDVILVRDGAQYRAEDLASGRTLLEAL